LDNVTSGLITYPDLRGAVWEGVTEAPVPLSIRRSGGRLYAVHTVNRFEDQSLRGVLVARINDSFSETVLRILESAGNSEIYLLNDTWDVVIGEPNSRVSPAVQKEVRAGLRETLSPVVTRTDTTLRFSQSIAGSRLVVVKSVPRSVIAGSASDTILAGLFAGGVLAAISLVLSVVFSFRISRPIAELAQSMQHATVPSFDQVRGQSRDDVRLLQEGYEALTLRMKNLVQKEYEQEMELKQAHLLALQAQINPHFLNNTLNLLGGMAMARGVPEIYAISRAMGDMFRYAAGGDGDLVTLNQEVTHTRNYLLIQEHRFAGRCSTTVRVDPDILTTPIPRFTLQPLVENAFEHGLQGKKGEWNVTIRGCRQARGTMVVVQDNGVGMSRDSVSTLRAGLRNDRHETKSTRSIGLRNVHARLKLHFGDGFGLRVFSLPMEGTRVVVVLPNASRRGVEE
jgi:two-component system sensor histidine kinase YesM